MSAVNHRKSASGNTYTLKPYSARQPSQLLNPKGIPQQGDTDMEKICSQTITIPPDLPDILKQYAKGAMRTQPPDLLRWSGAYFRAMANGETLPIKQQIEYPLRESKDGLTPGILRIIDNQLGAKGGQKVGVDQVLKRWRGFGLSVESFNDILARAQMTGYTVVEWDKVLALMASTIGQNLTDTMTIICEVLTEQPEGMEPLMNFSIWLAIYTYLGTQVLRVINQDVVQSVANCLSPVARENSGLIGPKHFTSEPCRLQ